MALRLAGDPAVLVGASSVGDTVDFFGEIGWSERLRVAIPHDAAEALYGVDAAESGHVGLEEIELGHPDVGGRLLVIGPLGGPAPGAGSALGLPGATQTVGPDGVQVARDDAFGARVVCTDPAAAASALEAVGARRRGDDVAIEGERGDLRLALAVGKPLGMRAGSVWPVLVLGAHPEADLPSAAEVNRATFDRGGHRVTVTTATLAGGLAVQVRTPAG